MLTAEVNELIADVSARVVLPRWRQLRHDQVFDKGHGDLVTVADREAEAEFAQALGGPGVLIVGEEATSEDPRALSELPGADHAWLIDPVDGTGNFARGSENFAVMLAELRHGQTVRSWISLPAQRRLYVAELDAGVTLNGRRLSAVPRGRTVRGPLQRGRPPNAPDWLEPRSSVRCCGVEYTALIDGRLDVLGYRSMKAWDHLPGALMVTELGGRAATVEGIDYAAGVTGRSLLVAASGVIWDRVHSVLS